MYQKIFKKEDRDLRERFLKLATLRELADLLEIEYRQLILILIIQKKYKKQYKTIFINKKSGGKRELNIPSFQLKQVQKKIAYILELFYEPPKGVCGFLKGKSIVDNAKQHTGSNFILNIDLKDFFKEVHFGRIKGLLMSKSFNLSPVIAGTISNLCCFEGHLPQGSPSSPIISNMICYKLDRRFQVIADSGSCNYSRYADDITFSTKKTYIPKRIFKTEKNILDPVSFLGEDIKYTILKNRFIINENKIRLQNKNGHQEVTGVTVNEKINLNREYIKKTRSMLYAWSKFGLDNAQKDFSMKYDIKDRTQTKNFATFKRIVQGRINYIKMILGEENPIFRKLYNKYNKLDQNKKDYLPITKLDKIEAAEWIISCNGKQGTAFIIKNIGLVTCYHVIEDYFYKKGVSINISKFDKPSIFFDVTPLFYNKEFDIAVFDVEKIPRKKIHHLESGNFEYKNNMDVITSGFPDYLPGDAPFTISNTICSIRKDKYANFRAILKTPVYSGQSGGPVIDSDNKVLGILKTGVTNQAQALSMSDMGVIPINYLVNLVNIEKSKYYLKIIKILKNKKSS